jgi:asparagine synthase (glutamine-hydrolysing)
MCGITGFIERDSPRDADRIGALIRDMTCTMVHRGPDSSGVWVDADRGVAVGHRRLAIRDLSPAGHQPMVSACERYVIAYNGEVYSHEEMRVELEAAGHRFRGTSDTEVILAGCAEWGVEATARKLIGMFAFALYDRRERRLSLVRDRIGIKPLYWGQFQGLFLFGSELKPLRRHPGWTPVVDRDAVSAFMRHNYIPAPHSIYRGVRKLTPGTVLTVQDGVVTEERPFWSLEEVAAHGLRSRRQRSDHEVIAELDTLLRDAVRRRMVADVPLGSLLSGGIDSTLVTALMQHQSDRPVRTFSIGFREQGFDEAPYAKAVARHLGTEHTELYVDSSLALDVVPRLPQIYDEPFADSSQLPTFLVCELTRRHVTVVLSGDGGDEVFAGYKRYELARSVSDGARALPEWLRTPTIAMARRLSPAGWDGVGRMIPRRIRPVNFGARMHQIADHLSLGDPDALYRRMLSHWQNPDALVRGGREPKGVLWSDGARRLVPDFSERMQYYDTLTYLPDDILTKVDRASMAVSLEARVPLLDHRVVEYAWALAYPHKWRDGQSKWVLRQVLDRYVPRELIDRPKAGFGVPFDQWIRGPLRDWAESLLSESRFARDQLLDPVPIRERWSAHLAGTNWGYPLWNVLMLHAWLDANPGVSTS